MSGSSDTTAKDVKADARDVAADIQELQPEMKKLSASFFDRGRDALQKATTDGTDKLAEWRDDIGHMASDLQDHGQHRIDAAKAQVRDRPLPSVLAAFGMGMLLARLCERRQSLAGTTTLRGRQP